MHPLATVGAVLALTLALPTEKLLAEELEWVNQKRELKTGPLLPRLTLDGDTQADGIAGITLRALSVQGDAGTTSVILDRSEYDFDDFGEGTLKSELNETTVLAKLQRLDYPDESGEGRHVFRITLDGGLFQDRIYVVLSPGPVTPDRLLIALDAPPPPKPGSRVLIARDGRDLRATNFDHIIPLRPVGSGAVLKSIPRHEPLSLATATLSAPGLDLNFAPAGIAFTGAADAESSVLTSQRDSTGQVPWKFGPYGDLNRAHVYMKAYPSEKRLRRVIDSQGKPWRLIEVQPVVVNGISRRRLTIVLSDQADGADRLLVREGQKLTHVVPLIDDERNRYLIASLALQDSPEEAAILDQFRPLISIRPTVTGGHIHKVRMSGPMVNPRTAAFLAELPELRGLSLADFHDDPLTEVLPALSRLHKLEDLGIQSGSVSDALLRSIAPLANLKSFVVYDNTQEWPWPDSHIRCSDAGLRFLRQHPSLAFLKLVGPGITDRGLEDLASIPSLNTLTLHQTNVRPAGVAAFGRVHPKAKIEVWHLHSRSNMNFRLNVDLDRGNVTFYGPGVADADLIALGALPGLSNFEVFNAPELTPAGLRALSGNPTLRTLSLQLCPKIDSSAEEFLSQMAGATSMQLRGNGIKPESIKKLQVALPNCAFPGY